MVALRDDSGMVALRDDSGMVAHRDDSGMVAHRDDSGMVACFAMTAAVSAPNTRSRPVRSPQ